MSPSKDKGKGKALARNTSSSDLRRRALDRAIPRHYDKKKRRAERRSLLDNPNPLDALYSIDEPSADDADDADDDDDNNNNNNNTGNVSAPYRSEGEWDAIRRSNEAMSEELAHLRAMIASNSQLANGATPGASGSRSRHDNNPPVALGQPALDDPPAPVARLRSAPEERPRRFVAIPPSKTKTHLKDIREYAGLTENAQRWLEICNIIRDLMTRVGMDYANSWLHQDKTKLGILYSLILKEAPELGIFQNGWATEWLVQNKFNNHRYYLGNKKRRYSHIKEEGSEEGCRLPPSPPPQVLAKPEDDEHGYRPPPPPKPLSPPEPSPQPEPLPPPEALPPLPRAVTQPPAAQEPASPPALSPAPHPRSPAHSPPPSRTSRPRPRQAQGGPGTRYNTRARATALASAVAQTPVAAKQSDQQDKATGRATRRKNQRHRSESPLRPLDESDDGGRLTEEEDA